MDNSPKTPKVAVIGTGARGKNPARNFARLGALSMVGDASTARVVNIYAVAANPDIEALAIASPGGALRNCRSEGQPPLKGLKIFVHFNTHHLELSQVSERRAPWQVRR